MELRESTNTRGQVRLFLPLFQATGGTSAEVQSPASPKGSQGFGRQRSVRSHTTSVRRRIARNTLWALCTAIPIQALRYRFVG